MSTLLLRLASPLQSWGDESRFATRRTRREPTKSGIVGLLAAAAGRRRTDPVEDLAALKFGCRLDQPGRLLRDFHTFPEAKRGAKNEQRLSTRFYLADAVFVAAVEGDDALIDGLADTLRAPAFPLFLGRRSCPAVGDVVIDTVAQELEPALRAVPWQASRWYRKTVGQTVTLELAVDEACVTGDARKAAPVESVRDVPLSFDPERREYGWRRVVRLWEDKPNPDGHDRPDFLAALGVAQ